MQKAKIKILFLFSTFFVGVAAYYIFYLPLTSVEKTTLNTEPSNVTSVQVPNKREDEQKTVEFYPLSPCKGENQYKDRLEWKAKGTIEVGVVNFRVLCGVLPELSQSERNKVSGKVTVEVLIDETGEVLKAQTKNEYSASLQKAVTYAARQTRFEPYMKRFEAYKARGILIYNFEDKSGVRLQQNRYKIFF